MTEKDFVYKAVERVLDDNSAWIARPSDEVTAAVADVARQSVRQEYNLEMEEIGRRIRTTMCPTFSAEHGERVEGRISERDFKFIFGMMFEDRYKAQMN